MSIDVLPSDSIVSEEEYKGLSRLRKGYFYEMHVQTMLDKLNIKYYGNPRQYKEWLKTTGKGHDIKVILPKGGWLKVECKFTLKHVYHSWIVNSWLSKSAPIIVTNNPYNISYRDRRLLELNGKKVLSTFQFKMYLTFQKVVNRYVQKLMGTLNKYGVFEYGNPSIDSCSSSKSREKYYVNVNENHRRWSESIGSEANKHGDSEPYTTENREVILVDKELNSREVHLLNRRLRKRSMELVDNIVDIKSKDPLIYTARAKPMNEDVSSWIVVYPGAIYFESEPTSHWNEPRLLERIEPDHKNREGSK